MKRTNVELDENQLRILELKGNVTWEGNLDEWQQTDVESGLDS